MTRMDLIYHYISFLDLLQAFETSKTSFLSHFMACFFRLLINNDDFCDIQSFSMFFLGIYPLVMTRMDLIYHYISLLDLLQGFETSETSILSHFMTCQS